MILKLLPAAWLALSAPAAHGVEVAPPVPIGPVPAIISAPIAPAGATPAPMSALPLANLAAPSPLPIPLATPTASLGAPALAVSPEPKALPTAQRALTALHSFGRGSAQERGVRADARLGSLFDGIKPADRSAESPVEAAAPETAGGVLDNLLRSEKPVVVAHGKNDYAGIAGESTWGNLAHSVEAARGRPVVIEADIRRAADGFIIFHDPTFHVQVRDYRTPPERIEAFQRENPELARQKEGQWDFLLLDGVGHHRTSGRGGDVKIYDRPSGLEYPLIGLGELLKSMERPGELRIPEHSYEARGPPAASGRIAPRTIAAGPIALYLDFKEINHLARRLYDLPDWHWIIGSWSTERIEDFTRAAIQNLSATLSGAEAHDKVFIAVRHPRIAALVRETDPRIAMMASPDDVGPQTSADDWIRSVEPFMAYGPKLVEVKYLDQMRDPKIRAWARAHGLKILYDQIPQTDPTQFEGAYRDDLGRLLSDIVELGPDVMIQTNTPAAVQSFIDGKQL